MEAALFNADGGAAAAREISNSFAVARVNSMVDVNRARC